MKSPAIKPRRAIFHCCLLAGGLFVAAGLVPAAHAQMADPSESLRTLMQNRQEMSKRAVDETGKRRFEDKISDNPFPSDHVRTKGGVVRALTVDEQKALQHNERGLDLFAKGKMDAAIKEYQEAIRFDPKLAAAHNNLGSAQFAAGRFEQAAASFRHSCELDAEFGQAFFNLALAQLKLGQQKEASESLDAALRAYVSTGDTELRAGNLKEAEEAYRGMLQIDPDYAPALVRLGLVCNAAGRYEEAVQYLRRVVDREPTNGPLLELLAEALYGQNKYEEAAVTAERAIKLNSDSANAHYLAGLARAASGAHDVALIHLARLRELKSAELADKLSNFINRPTRTKP